MRVEKMLIRKTHNLYKACRSSCLSARYLYNSANYIIRQEFTKSHKVISWMECDKKFKQENNKHYRSMPGAAAAQRTLLMLGNDWKSFFKANKEYSKHPDKLKARPKLPGYCKSIKSVVIQRNGFKVKDGILTITGIGSIKIRCIQDQAINEKASKSRLQEVRIIPMGEAFVMHLAYKEEKQEDVRSKQLKMNRYAGIDFGVRNLVTITAVGEGLNERPILCKGGRIKSENQRWNKQCAELKSLSKGNHIKAKTVLRYFRLDDYLHKLSHFVIEYCLDRQIGVLCLGHNKNWKQEINIGKVNNQKFVQIPYNKLQRLIKYKAEAVGIKVLETEESYTSKASALELDVIPEYGSKKENNLFSGKRISRGLYRTGTGKLINADVNGSLNIIRKAVQNEVTDSYVSNLGVGGLVYRPMVADIATIRITGLRSEVLERNCCEKPLLYA